MAKVPKNKIAQVVRHKLSDADIDFLTEKELSFVDAFERNNSPSKEEITRNPRARSAKLRIFEK